MMGIDWNINHWKFLGDGVIDYINSHLAMILIVLFLIIVVIYSMIAVFLNKLNKTMYGNTTWLAWVPVYNIFLLGKLTIHTVVGFILVICFLLSISVYTYVDGVEKIYSILPKNILEPFQIVYWSIILILYIYAHFKLNNIRRSGTSQEHKSEVTADNMSTYDQIYNNKDNINYGNAPQVNTNTYVKTDTNVENDIEKPKISLQSINHNHDTSSDTNNQNP